jgi:hypothetical protein
MRTIPILIHPIDSAARLDNPLMTIIVTGIYRIINRGGVKRRPLKAKELIIQCARRRLAS